MIFGLLLLGLVIFILVGVIKLTGPLIATVLKAALVILALIAIIGFFVPPLEKSGNPTAETSAQETVTVDLN